MKHIKILLVITLVGLFSSCKQPEPPLEGVTSYTLVSKINFGALGYGIDMTIYEYDAQDNRLDSNVVAQPEYQREYTFYPPDTVHHLKLKLTSSENTVRWANQIFYLQEGQNLRLEAVLNLVTNPNAYCFNEPKP